MATDRRWAEINHARRPRRPPPPRTSHGGPASVDAAGRRLGPHAVLDLQRLVGNKATAAILRASAVDGIAKGGLAQARRRALRSDAGGKVSVRREALPPERSTVEIARAAGRPAGDHASTRHVVQRMVGINSSDIAQELAGLVSGGSLGNTVPWTEAYTLLQHIDWAHNIVNGEAFDMGSPAFNKVGSGENLILVAHGVAGTSGTYDGTQIANLLADKQTGVPPNWTGAVFITSCYSGVGPGSVAEEVATQLGVLSRPGISVTGYRGSTYTHKRFDEALFVLDEAKKSQIDLIASNAEKKYAHLFVPWLKEMQNLKVDNLLEMAAYTANLTDQVYEEIVEKAAAQGLFLDTSDAEVTHVSQ